MLKADYIAELIKDGEIAGESDPLVIAPFSDENWEDLQGSGAASIDLRLGTWFVTLKHYRMSSLQVSHPSTQFQLTKTHYVPFGREFYLHPGKFALAITLEWVRIPTTLAGYVIGKSKWGRRGLIIATAAGVHPGFTGCLTLELSNVGEIPIAINPGMSLCQLCLHRVEHSSAIIRDAVDQTRYMGQRKPMLGDIEPDDTATALFELNNKSIKGTK